MNGYNPEQKEIDNPKVAELAGRLKGRSYSETITNILDWQHMNMSFWFERWPLAAYLLILPLCISILGFCICILFHFVWVMVLSLGFLLAGFTALSLLLVYSTGIFDLESGNKIIVLFRFMMLILKRNMPIGQILDYKKGVCRDYAKLTACLILKQNSNAEVYFVSTKNNFHVAAGQKIEGNVYILDRTLPVMTINGWAALNKLAKIEMRDKTGKLITVKPGDVGVSKVIPYNNIEGFCTRMNVLLDSEHPRERSGIKLELFKKWVKWYEECDIVDYSIARYVARRIANEVHRGNLAGITVEREDDGIAVDLFYK